MKLFGYSSLHSPQTLSFPMGLTPSGMPSYRQRLPTCSPSLAISFPSRSTIQSAQDFYSGKWGDSSVLLLDRLEFSNTWLPLYLIPLLWLRVVGVFYLQKAYQESNIPQPLSTSLQPSASTFLPSYSQQGSLPQVSANPHPQPITCDFQFQRQPQTYL